MNKLKTISAFTLALVCVLANEASAQGYYQRRVTHHGYSRPVIQQRFRSHHVYPRQPVYVSQPVVTQQVIYEPIYQPMPQPCPAPVQVISQPIYVQPPVIYNQPFWGPRNSVGVYLNSFGQAGLQINSRW